LALVGNNGLPLSGEWFFTGRILLGNKKLENTRQGMGNAFYFPGVAAADT
jgi:hypothetical protein